MISTNKMIFQNDSDRSILARLLEKGIEIILRKECKKISDLQIKIFASTKQIFKGLINKIHIEAKDINYKELYLDEVDLETEKVNIQFRINKELKLKNDFSIDLKIKLSEKSLKRILFSKNWSWIKDLLSREMLNTNNLDNLKIINDQIELEAITGTSKNIERINIGSKNGKIFLENKSNNKSILIPIEDKVYIKSTDLKDNSITLLANSTVSL
tara:strand:- start:6790 stop:7431 length:642 start_codon:yes stop_codon:yes gene_type:complete